jgi:acid stress chaperone HdeB
MKKIFALLGLFSCISVISPASAQVLVDMSQITCKEFASYDADTRALLAAWYGGYYSAGKNLNVVQSDYVQRNTEKVHQYCKKHKKEMMLSVVEKVAH